MDARSECDRHVPFTPSADPAMPWFIVRCCHIGDRFVVECSHYPGKWNFVDYVETTQDRTELIGCENGRPEDWDRFVARMERGDPPVSREFEADLMWERLSTMDGVLSVPMVAQHFDLSLQMTTFLIYSLILQGSIAWSDEMPGIARPFHVVRVHPG